MMKKTGEKVVIGKSISDKRTSCLKYMNILRAFYRYNSWICWDPKEKNKYNRRVVKSNLDEIDDGPADLQRNCGRQSP
ncbi:unnamed protein product [Rhizophagus irregularis]|nr:unnamed protein product [Rhizophagus irregularis]